MVRRLVQKQNFKRRCQRFRKRLLFSLPAGKMLHFHIMIRNSKLLSALSLHFQRPVILRNYRQMHTKEQSLPQETKDAAKDTPIESHSVL